MVVIGTVVNKVVVPVAGTLPIDTLAGLSDILGKRTKITTAAIMRTITIPATIFIGNFPKRDEGGGGAPAEKATGCGGIAEERGWDFSGAGGLSGIPQFSQNFISSDNEAPQLLQNFWPI
jgi:hypothetical protein